MKNKKFINKMLVSALTVSMLLSSALPAQAAKTSALVVSNKREVLVTGRSYHVKTKGATKVTSSNAKIATVTKSGKILPKKTGYVTLTAVVDGKKISKKFLCVSKDGRTNSQSKVNAMLKAPNVKKITVKDTKNAKDYKFAQGDFSEKTLTVDAGLSDATNSGTFEDINIVDIKDGTWTELGQDNNFYITDKNISFVSGEGSSIENFNYDAPKGNIKAELKGNMKNMEITAEDASMKLDVSGSVENIAASSKGTTLSIDTKKESASVGRIMVSGEKSNISLTGNSKEASKVEVTEKAKGTALKVDTVAAELNLKSDTKVEVGAKAKDVKVTTAEGVKSEVSVSKDSTAVVTIKDTAGKETVVKPGESIEIINPVTPDQKPIVPTYPDTEPEVKVTEVKAVYNADKNETTYTLENGTKFENLKGVKVSVATAKYSDELNITSDMIQYGKALLNGENKYLAVWKSDGVIVKDFSEGKNKLSFAAVIKNGSDFTRKLTLASSTNAKLNGDYDVTVTEDTGVVKKISFKKTKSATVYTIAKTAVNAYTVSNGTTTYRVSVNADQNVVTVSGNTTEKVKVISVTQ